MAHTVEILEIKEVSDELVSYRLRCCGEELSDTWHTLSVLIPDHDGQLESRKAEIAARHQAKVAWRKQRKP